LVGHDAGGAEGRVYRFRGYADFLASDGGSDNDTAGDDSDDYELHLLTGSLVADFDVDGNKTIYVVVEAGHDEDNPIVVGPGQTIGGTFDLATDSRFAVYDLDLGTEDFSDTRFWEIA